MADGIVYEIRRALFDAQDTQYRDFTAKLLPTVDSAAVIGVRTPQVRALAKQYAASPEIATFLDALPHQYVEENNLHGFLLERIKDYDKCMARMEAFLPYIDNWATCDCTSPKVFGKHKPELLQKIPVWLSATHTYTVRFAIGMLMKWFLDDDFSCAYMDWVVAVRSEKYYIRMMQAWYFATALAKQYDAAISHIEQRTLEPWTHNKAIQKACESFRVTAEHKAYLKTLKVY